MSEIKTDLNALHLSLVVHIVHSQTSLVDEEVYASIHLDKQFFCVQHHKDKICLPEELTKCCASKYVSK